MRTNILTLCDFAKEYCGQLSITGTFNQIRSNVFPTEPVSFYIVCQFVIKENIVGEHRVTVSVTNTTSGVPLVKDQELKLKIMEKGSGSSDHNFMTNLIIKMDNLTFETPASYTVKVISDNNVQELEFYVVKA